MARNLFIAQATLATWTEQDKVAFDKNIMTIKADGRSFRLIEAVRFVAIEGGGQDTPGLLGRVKTDLQLKKMGAERCHDSVIYQDLAYKVQEGFLAEVLLEDISRPEMPALAPARPQAAVPPRPDPVAAPASQSEVAPRQAERPAVRTPLEASLAGIDNDGKPKSGEENSDVELLTKFLLENL